MGLQGVGGHSGVVTPDLAEQGVPSDRPVARAIQVLRIAVSFSVRWILSVGPGFTSILTPGRKV